MQSLDSLFEKKYNLVFPGRSYHVCIAFMEALFEFRWKPNSKEPITQPIDLSRMSGMHSLDSLFGKRYNLVFPGRSYHVCITFMEALFEFRWKPNSKERSTYALLKLCERSFKLKRLGLHDMVPTTLSMLIHASVTHNRVMLLRKRHICLTLQCVQLIILITGWMPFFFRTDRNYYQISFSCLA